MTTTNMSHSRRIVSNLDTINKKQDLLVADNTQNIEVVDIDASGL